MIPFTKGGIEVCVVVGIVSWILRRILDKDFDLRSNPLYVPLCFYFAAVLLSFLNSTIPAVSAKGLLRVCKYGFLYFLVTDTIRSEFRVRWLLRLILLAALLSCANGFYQMQSGWDFRHQYPYLIVDGIKRIAGSFNHPNNFAAFLCVVILILVYLKDSWSWNLLRLIAFPCLFYMLFQTKSRLPLVLSVLTLFSASLIDKSFRKRSTIFLILAISGVTVYCYFTPSYLQHLASMIFGDARTQYWNVCITLIKEHFLFGSGINTFMNVFGNSHGMNHYGENRFLYAHNFILQMWVEIGFFGLSAFILMLVQFFRNSAKYLAQTNEIQTRHFVFGIISSLVFFLLHSSVDNNLQSLQLTTLFWVLIGSVMGITRTSIIHKGK